MKTPLKCRIKNFFRFRPISPSKVFYYNCAIGLRCVDDRCVQCPNDLRERTAINLFLKGFDEGLKRGGMNVDEYEMEPRPLKLAFIGYDEGQTRQYFAEFAKVNSDQVSNFHARDGRILFKDGTVVCRVRYDRNRLMGCQFDQVIVAVDGRGVYSWPEERFDLMCNVRERMSRSCVPDQFLTIIYDLDSEVKADG